MGELRVTAKSSAGLKHNKLREGRPTLFNPPRWEFSMSDGSAPPVEIALTHTFVRQPGPATGSTLDIASAKSVRLELEDMTDDISLLALDFSLGGSLPFLCISDIDKLLSVKRIVVDVRAVEYTNPVTTLGIILMCETLLNVSGRKVNLLLPGDKSHSADIRLSACLRSPDFLTSIQDLAADVNGRPVRNHRSDMALVKTIASCDDIVSSITALDRLKDAWAGTCDIVTVTSELCQNILHHSMPYGSPRGYLAIQIYAGALQLAVADMGIGIPSSLRNTEKCKDMDDIQILREACKPGVSSKGYCRGLGMSRSLDIIKGSRGYMNICSGSAGVLFGYDVGFGQRRRELYTDGNAHGIIDCFCGTQIGILFSLKAHNVRR